MIFPAPPFRKCMADIKTFCIRTNQGMYNVILKNNGLKRKDSLFLMKYLLKTAFSLELYYHQGTDLTTKWKTEIHSFYKIPVVQKILQTILKQIIGIEIISSVCKCGIDLRSELA